MNIPLKIFKACFFQRDKWLGLFHVKLRELPYECVYIYIYTYITYDIDAYCMYIHVYIHIYDHTVFIYLYIHIKACNRHIGCIIYMSCIARYISRRTRYRPRISAEHCVSPQWQCNFVVPNCLKKMVVCLLTNNPSSVLRVKKVPCKLAAFFSELSQGL